MSSGSAELPRLVAYRLDFVVQQGACECDDPSCPARLIGKYWAAQFAVGDHLRLICLMGRN